MDLRLPPVTNDYIERDGAFIHRLANLVGDVRIGRGSRVDAFVTITGNVSIGRYCHIGTGVMLFGGAGITVGDYVGFSGGSKVFSSTEDVGGEWITNPTVPLKYRNPINAHIRIGDHAEMGAGSIAFPGAELPEGAYLGALSMVKHRLEPWSINVGVPAKFKRWRSRGALLLAKEFECSST